MLATLAIAVLALYLLIGEPLLGRHAHRQLLAALDAGVPDARRCFYHQWTWQGWALLLATLVVTLGMAGWTVAAALNRTVDRLRADAVEGLARAPQPAGANRAGFVQWSAPVALLLLLAVILRGYRLMRDGQPYERSWAKPILLQFRHFAGMNAWGGMANGGVNTTQQLRDIPDWLHTGVDMCSVGPQPARGAGSAVRAVDCGREAQAVVVHPGSQPAVRPPDDLAEKP